MNYNYDKKVMPSISENGKSVFGFGKMFFYRWFSKYRVDLILFRSEAHFVKFGVKPLIMEQIEDGTYMMPKEAATSKVNRRRTHQANSPRKHERWKNRKKKKQKDKKKKVPKGMRSEGVFSYLSNRVTELKVQGISDKILDFVERVTLLIANLYDSTSWTQFFSAVGLFGKTFTTKSYTMILKELIYEHFEFRSEGIGEFHSFMQSFRECVYDFKLLKANPIGEKISAVISFAIALGICGDRSEFSMNVGSMRMFKIQAFQGHCSCLDLIEAILDSIELLVTRGYQCFLTGSAKPLFCTTTDASKAEEAYTRLIGYFEAIRMGQFEKTDGHYSSVKDYEAELSETIKFMENLLPLATNVMKTLLMRRIEGLRVLMTDLELMKTPGGLRESPFGFLIYGSSGVGKSTIVDKLTVFVLQKIAQNRGIENYTPDRKSICTLNDTDKYMSDYKAYIRAVILDDLANAKAETTDVNPSVNVINLINNVRRTAVMADAKDKGKIQLEPEMVAATTNSWIKWARSYSNEPVSILRRFKLHMAVTVKEEFSDHTGRLNEEAMTRFALDNPGKTPDAWNITLYEIYGVNQGFGEPQKPDARVKFFQFEGEDSMRQCKNLSLFETMQVVADSLKLHMAAQESVVKNSEKMFEEPLCEHGNDGSLCPRCNPMPFYVESDNEFMESEGIFKGLKSWKEDIKTQSKRPYKKKSHFDLMLEETYGVKIPFLSPERCRMGSRAMTREFIQSTYVDTNEERIQNIVSSADWLKETLPFGNTWFNPLMYLPTSIKQSLRFKMWYFFHHNPQYRLYSKIFLYSGCASLLSLASSYLLGSRSLGLLGAFSATVSGLVGGEVRRQYRDHVERYWENVPHLRDLIPETVNQILTDYQITGKKLFGAFATITVVYAAYKAGLALYKNCNIRGEGMAKDDFFSVDYGQSRVTIPDEYARTAQPEQMEKRLQKSIVSIERRKGDKVLECLGFFVQSGFLVIPRHAKPDDGESFKIRHNHAVSQPRVYSMVWSDKMTRIVGDDMIVTYVPSSGDMYDWTSFLPNSVSEGQITIRLGFWDLDRKWNYRLMKTTGVQPCRTEVAYIKQAIYTDFGEGYNTFIGQCGSVALAKHGVGGTYIVGLHLAGNGKNRGALEALLNKPCKDAIADILDSFQIVQQIPEASGPCDKYLDKELVFVSEAPDNSPVSRVGPGSYEFHGYDPKSPDYHPTSAVRNSFIKVNMEKVFGLPQKWGPPANCRRGSGRVPAWRPYQSYLEGVAVDQWQFSGPALEQATKDYTDHILPLFNKKELRPLSHEETINGIDTEPFMRSMKSGTSMGYPINKSKADFMLGEDGLPFETGKKDFVEPVIAEIEVAMKNYEEGKRNYFIFKACTKDEPTKLTKDKVRIFQAANYLHQYAIRKYFLPLCNEMSKNPLLTECAVGIDPHSPDWDRLYRHLLENGEDRVIAGDFANFDHKATPEISWAVFSVFFKIAKAAGYSDADIKTMRAIAADVIYPVMNMSGHLLSIFGSNPSGQNLTVYYNSVLNSILHRYAFFQQYPVGFLSNTPFASVVRLTTYGDDCFMTVRKGYDRFNHTTIQQEFGKMNCKYTMADKDQESVPYINIFDADYLKRKTVFRREYGKAGMYIAQLDENSIYKSLYCNMLSDVDPPEAVSAMAIEGAIREWFFYGEEVYEDRRAKVLEVAKLSGLDDLIHRDCYMSFEQMDSAWRDKYQIQRV